MGYIQRLIDRNGSKEIFRALLKGFVKCFFVILFNHFGKFPLEIFNLKFKKTMNKRDGRILDAICFFSSETTVLFQPCLLTGQRPFLEAVPSLMRSMMPVPAYESMIKTSWHRLRKTGISEPSTYSGLGRREAHGIKIKSLLQLSIHILTHFCLHYFCQG